MSRWFRHYGGMMRDEKLVSAAVKSKQPVERVVWVWGAILESASEVNDGGRYEFECGEAAYFLRCDVAELEAIIHALSSLGRLHEGIVGKWADRQYESDTSTGRVRKFREKQSANQISQRNSVSDKERNNDETLQDSFVTPPDTDTEEDTEKKERKNLKVLSKEKRGTRLPDNFEPDESCHQLAESLLLTNKESQDALDNFLDYWRAVPGAKGLKLDWQMTFKNQLRHVSKQKEKTNGRPNGKTTRSDAFAILDAVTDEAIRREGRGPDSDETNIVELPGLRESAA